MSDGTDVRSALEEALIVISASEYPWYKVTRSVATAGNELAGQKPTYTDVLTLIDPVPVVSGVNQYRWQHVANIQDASHELVISGAVSIVVGDLLVSNSQYYEIISIKPAELLGVNQVNTVLVRRRDAS